MKIGTRADAEIPRLVQALFCAESYNVRFYEGSFSCRHSDCECAVEQPMQTLLDLFGTFYYFLDANNDTFFNARRRSYPRSKEIRKTLDAAWQSHLQTYPYGGLNGESLVLHDATKALVRTDLEHAANADELIVKIGLWLLTWDEHLGSMKTELELTGQEWTFPCCRGLLIAKRSSSLQSYLFDRYDKWNIAPPRDANYVELRHLLQHFHLLHRPSRRYEVKHLKLQGAAHLKNVDLGQMRIGFLAGDLTAEDYEWETDFPLVEEDGQPFRFLSIQRDGYQATLEQELKQVLEQNPDFVILPELYTPLESQKHLSEQWRHDYRLKKEEGHTPNHALLMPGSFHERKSVINGQSLVPEQDGVYNYSRVVNGLGRQAMSVYKLNSFHIPKSTAHKGLFAPFCEHDGVEHIETEPKELCLLETTLGRVAVLICIDFIIEGITEILRERHVDLVFVMAYTGNPDGGKFERAMHTLGEQVGATVIICNNLGKRSPGSRFVAYFPGLQVPFVRYDRFGVFTLDEMVMESHKRSIEQRAKKRKQQEQNS